MHSSFFDAVTESLEAKHKERDKKLRTKASTSFESSKETLLSYLKEAAYRNPLEEDAPDKGLGFLFLDVPCAIVLNMRAGDIDDEHYLLFLKGPLKPMRLDIEASLFTTIRDEILNHRRRYIDAITRESFNKKLAIEKEHNV